MLRRVVETMERQQLGLRQTNCRDGKKTNQNVDLRDSDIN